MKLYEAPRDSRIALNTDDGQRLELNFQHIDGMYLYCTDDAGDVVHLAAWAEVELIPSQARSTTGG